jgi:hypothetical protein
MQWTADTWAGLYVAGTIGCLGSLLLVVVEERENVIPPGIRGLPVGWRMFAAVAMAFVMLLTAALWPLIAASAVQRAVSRRRQPRE